MALESLLASLKSGVSQVAGVQASSTKACTGNPGKVKEVAEVSVNGLIRPVATCETPANPSGVSLEPMPLQPGTRETSATEETTIGNAILTRVGVGETAIASRKWLLRYLDEEIDPAIMAEVIGQCQRDAGARSHFIERAEEELQKAERFPDDRRTCDQCANLAGRRCLAAKRGEIVASSNYEPIHDLLRRCEGYVPGADEPERRCGRERWPHLSLDFTTQFRKNDHENPSLPNYLK
jgi:hypothetical protein